MGKGSPERISLIGFSYTGKSIIGQRVAMQLGWSFVDTDEVVVRRAGKSIPRIFAEDGEEAFREMERRVLRDVLSREMVVVATGGGAVLDSGNRKLMLENSTVICLEAAPETIYQRLRGDAQEPGSVARPLLAGDEPLKRIESMKTFRQPFYAVADWTVHTDNLTPDEVAQEVIRGFRFAQRRFLEGKPAPVSPANARESDSPYCLNAGAACVVATDTRTYPVFVDWGIMADLGKRMRNVGLSGAVSLISDEHVFALHGTKAMAALTEAGFAPESCVVPAGETTKSVESATRIYEWLVGRRIERGNAVVGLGGGMIGDLAGFVAATYLRGLPLIHVPTSLLAMSDAAIGGKVAVNLTSGKNLVGAFYQPRLVVIDVQTLQTLPQRELISGWAEVVKHAFIMDVDLFDFLDSHIEQLRRLDPEVTAVAVRRSAGLKAQVVSEDEKETGRRIILNYGHTVGHALEAVTAYEVLLHGEAVSIGMMAAALISREMALISDDVVEKQRTLLEAFGLPVSYRGVSIQSVLDAMSLDKKVRGKAIRWVLLGEMGQAVVRSDVPQEIVLRVLSELLSEG